MAWAIRRRDAWGGSRASFFGLEAVSGLTSAGRFARASCNKNAIPFDPEKPAVSSGVRLGTSAGTTRGFGEPEFRRVGESILTVVNALASVGPNGDASVEAAVLEEVQALCRRFPFYR